MKRETILFRYFTFIILLVCLSLFHGKASSDVNLFQKYNLKIANKIKIFNKDDQKIIFFDTLVDDKKYIINFWATWCVPCKKELPELQEMQNQNKDLEILIISIDRKNINEQLNFLNKHKVTNLKIYFDKDMLLFKSLKLRGIPTTLIVKKREVIAKKEGIFNYSKKSIKEINSFF